MTEIDGHQNGFHWNSVPSKRFSIESDTSNGGAPKANNHQSWAFDYDPGFEVFVPIINASKPPVTIAFSRSTRCLR
jgi:hypothetical protein